jgi:hypothetical protein
MGANFLSICLISVQILLMRFHLTQNEMKPADLLVADRAMPA